MKFTVNDLDMYAYMAQFKLIIKLRKQYIIDYIFKYGTGNLIILYCYVYSRLSGTMGDIVWKSMELMRSAGSSSQING